jgi:hypothetical protein
VIAGAPSPTKKVRPASTSSGASERRTGQL